VLIIHSAAVAKAYTQYFEALFQRFKKNGRLYRRSPNAMGSDVVAAQLC
jgi:hypothetical protein